jgi:hypothetical protein
MLLDRGTLAAADVVLWGARNLDPPRRSSSPRPGSGTIPRPCWPAPTAVYVALDCDVFDPDEVAVFMPEPGGPSLARSSSCWRACGTAASSWEPASRASRPIPANVEKLGRLTAALGY